VIGVGAVVFNERDEILLIRRGKPPHYGRWMVPGGSLEWGETLADAAVREVREETGIDIEVEAFVEVVEAITRGDGDHHFVIIDYAAHAIGGHLQADSDALDAAWIGMDSLPGHDLTEELKAVIEKARRITHRGVEGPVVRPAPGEGGTRLG
jgi:8-oxo-dGTP diphosphatase